jgi:hypothetical protein
MARRTIKQLVKALAYAALVFACAVTAQVRADPAEPSPDILKKCINDVYTEKGPYADAPPAPYSEHLREVAPRCARLDAWWYWHAYIHTYV